MSLEVMALVCVEAAETVAPCPSGMQPVAVPGYLLDATAGPLVQALITPVSYDGFGALTVQVVASVCLIYVTSRMFGAVARLIR